MATSVKTNQPTNGQTVSSRNLDYSGHELYNKERERICRVIDYSFGSDQQFSILSDSKKNMGSDMSMKVKLPCPFLFY